jgi:hypothetical protein
MQCGQAGAEVGWVNVNGAEEHGMQRGNFSNNSNSNINNVCVLNQTPCFPSRRACLCRWNHTCGFN